MSFLENKIKKLKTVLANDQYRHDFVVTWYMRDKFIMQYLRNGMYFISEGMADCRCRAMANKKVFFHTREDAIKAAKKGFVGNI